MAKTPNPPAPPPPRPPAAKKAAAPPPKHGQTPEAYARRYYEWLRGADPMYVVSLLRQGPSVLADHVAGVGRHARELFEHHHSRGAPVPDAEAAAVAVLSREDHDPPEPSDAAGLADAIAAWEETDEAAPFLPPRPAAAE